MATKEFIFQGFTSRTHGQAVRELFDVGKVVSVSISMAFVNEGGVEHIEEAMKPHAKVTRLFAGIRNEITSFQGLERLRKLIGSKLYTVDTGSRLIVFHPKLFLVRGDQRARMLIGSANLTLGGLNNNVEAGLLLDCQLDQAADMALVKKVEAQLDGMVANYGDHVAAVSSKHLLEGMLKSGRLIDERALPPPRPQTSVQETVQADTLRRIALKVPRIRRPLTKASAPKKPMPGKSSAAKSSASVPASTGVDFELVWESKPLTRRDLTIPTATGTHATGSISLDKGLLPEDVDHRHYFREEVFPELTWSHRSATVDEAYAKFHLVVKGISHGDFDLAIRHTTGTDTKSYKQRNAMTRLSWGPMREHIAREDLIGRTIALYRDNADTTRFMLEID
jgi:HKD family nuclease